MSMFQYFHHIPYRLNLERPSIIFGFLFSGLTTLGFSMVAVRQIIGSGLSSGVE